MDKIAGGNQIEKGRINIQYYSDSSSSKKMPLNKQKNNYQNEKRC